MKIVIAGGSGFIGRALCEALTAADHEVTVFSRAPGRTRSRLSSSVAVVGWDGHTHGAWQRTLEGADAVVNLAGENTAEKRWSEGRKGELRKSRVLTTRLLVQAIAGLSQRPAILINASAIGYYGTDGSTSMTERTPAGSGFLGELSVAWEQEAKQAEALGLRVVRLRIGLVLDKDGGALARMILPFRLFLGGSISPGTQWVSWIHRHDLVRLIQWVLKAPEARGAINAVAPGAVTMLEFCRTLGRSIRRPCWLSVPQFALHLALGEMAILLTTGARVEPAVATGLGFAFQYPSLEPAFQAIFNEQPTQA